MSALFSHKRSGKIHVHLNRAGRAFAKMIFERVLAAETDSSLPWHGSLNPPLAQGSVDDPFATLSRQQQLSSNAELALLTVEEDNLTPDEAWAWLATFQVALRASSEALGIETTQDLEAAPKEALDELRGIQEFLFDLSNALDAD
jgi:hypothetical protein